MITADNPYIVVDSSETTFSTSAKVNCIPTYIKEREFFSVIIQVLNSSTELEELRTVIDLTKTEVDAETGSGTGETDNWYKALQEAIVTKLEAFAGNSGVTFTTSV